MRQLTSSPAGARRVIVRMSGLSALAGLALLGVAGPATAATSGTGTTNAVLGAGTLAVNSVGSATNISGTVGSTVTGDLPAVTLQDSTGSGSGWNSTVQVSDLSYTGTWVAQGTATALTTASSSPFTDTVDGVTYTVTTGAIAAGIGSFTYTSTDANDPSGSGSAAASTNSAVGKEGLTINFGLQTLASGSVYVIHAGTQSPSVISLDTTASGAGVTTTSGNTQPNLINTGTTVYGSATNASAYGSAVKFASAGTGTGMGTYVVTPGVQVSTDGDSWAGTYSAGLQYSIVTGP